MGEMRKRSTPSWPSCQLPSALCRERTPQGNQAVCHPNACWTQLVISARKKETSSSGLSV